MSEDLHAVIMATTEKLRLSPETACATFRSSSQLRERFRSDISIRAHRLVVDEPPQLGGLDAGPNPIELLLAALGACQEITYKAYATALGIELRSVAVELEGDIDLRGFLGVDDTVRAGFQQIRGQVRIDADAAPDELAHLKRLVDTHCPVLDMLSLPVPVTLNLEKSAKSGIDHSSPLSGDGD
ncbi:MAG: OsmC family protein [Gammaproteobacteria bacterium]